MYLHSIPQPPPHHHHRRHHTSGATTADIQHDLKKGLLVVLGEPRIISGSGDMRHMQHPTFAFHLMNRHMRDLGDSTARNFVKRLAKDNGVQGYDSSAIAKMLSDLDPEETGKKLLSFSRSMPNTPQACKKAEKELSNMQDELGPPTIFLTHSSADTYCPHLHALIVKW